jgi:hypothetical protein
VLVEVDSARPEWLPLADILFTPVQDTRRIAVAVARTLAGCWPGCSLIAVPVSDRSVVIYAAERVVSVRVSAGGAFETAIRRYCQLLGH